MRKVEDPTGQKFARLLIIEFFRIKGKNPFCKCLCDCGKEIISGFFNIRNGHTKSCGCLNNENRSKVKPNLTHGMSKSPEYKAWQSMQWRCNPNYWCRSSYFDKDIKVCERWKNSFDIFYKDLGPRPSPKHSLDRINNHFGYEPGNVQWSLPIDQANNKSTTIFLTYGDLTLALEEWARYLNMDRGLMYKRLFKCGWSFEKILATKTKKSYK